MAVSTEDDGYQIGTRKRRMLPQHEFEMSRGHGKGNHHSNHQLPTRQHYPEYYKAGLRLRIPPPANHHWEHRRAVRQDHHVPPTCCFRIGLTRLETSQPQHSFDLRPPATPPTTAPTISDATQNSGNPVAHPYSYHLKSLHSENH